MLIQAHTAKETIDWLQAASATFRISVLQSLRRKRPYRNSFAELFCWGVSFGI
jgi:hypothetical protein